MLTHGSVILGCLCVFFFFSLFWLLFFFVTAFGKSNHSLLYYYHWIHFELKSSIKHSIERSQQLNKKWKEINNLSRLAVHVRQSEQTITDFAIDRAKCHDLSAIAICACMKLYLFACFIIHWCQETRDILWKRIKYANSNINCHFF